MTSASGAGDPPGYAELRVCVRCIVKPAESECCSSHQAPLCHKCYRLTHFVEICGCLKCDAEGLPRILGERSRGGVVSRWWKR